MTSIHSRRFMLFCTASFLLLSWICQAQSEPPGTNPSGMPGRNTRGSNSVPGSGPRSQPGPHRQRYQLIFISGTVVMEDGSEIPRNISIERVCGNRRIKEAYADSSGSFSFQLGGNANVMPDASDDGIINRNIGWSAATVAPQSAFGSESTNSPDLFGCDLQAQSAGYRSSSVILAAYPANNQINIGTLVLQPINRAKGTKVSVVSLQAPKNAKKALDKAEQAEKKNLPDQAEKLLMEAVELYPQYATAWFDLGQLKMRKQQFENARDAFEKSIAADPNYVLPHLELTRIALISGDWARAAEISDKTIALDSIGFPETYLLNGLANLNLNKLDLSEKSARKALRLDPGHRYVNGFLLLADILQLKQDYQGTAEQLRNYLRYAASDSRTQKVKDRLEEIEKNHSDLAAGRPAP
jgi:tetratricopeptide (TPR) repeat protein